MRVYIKRLNDYLFNQKKDKVFAQGFCKRKLFFMFLFGCIFGCVWEEFLNLVYTYKTTGVAIFETRRGLLWGELSPIYGFGCVLLLVILMHKKRNFFEYYAIGSLTGGCYEYMMSFLQEKLTGAISWDYSNMFLNLNGRTTIPYMLFWGLMAVILVYIFYPLVSYLVEKMPYNFGKLIYHILVVLICLDLVITYAAVGRQTLRNAGYPPYTIVGKTLDKYFPNERIAKSFTNAKFVE